MIKRAVSLLILAAVVSGCQNIRSWSYSPAPRASSAPIADKSVAVLVFEDRRKNENSNRIMLYLIPLMPFGWADFETPEGVQMHINSGIWQFRPPDDFTRAFAQEVENARIFRETFVSNKPSEGDLVLTGEIVETGYHGKLYSYCLSAYGPILWFIGLPASTVSNSLELRLRLARTPSDPPLWTYTIQEKISETSWLYVMESDFRYDELLKKGMPGALQSLQEAVRKLE